MLTGSVGAGCTVPTFRAPEPAWRTAIARIYLKVEVRDRELEGRLLLALVAAERGHEILVGNLRSMLTHRHWLPPGVFHDKSLSPAGRKIALHERLDSAGFLVSSQDEEHGLLSRDYAPFAARRFSEATLASARTVFNWGPFDAAGLANAYPSARDRMFETGSPRADLWRPEFDGLYQNLPLGLDLPERPFVLIVSNSAALGHSPFWNQARKERQRGADSDARASLAESEARRMALQFAHLAEVIHALRIIVPARPDLTFVVRPHHIEDASAWGELLDLPNVLVTRGGGIGRWIRRARVVVHTASTTALEAAAAGVPSIAFTPTAHRVDWISNEIGRRATTVGELASMIDASGDPSTREAWETPHAQGLLASRLGVQNGRLAADRIVDVWEEHLTSAHVGSLPLRRSQFLASAHRQAGVLRRGQFRIAPHPVEVIGDGTKFPRLSAPDVAQFCDGLRGALDRFRDVDVETVGPRLLRVRGSR